MENKITRFIPVDEYIIIIWELMTMNIKCAY